MAGTIGSPLEGAHDIGPVRRRLAAGRSLLDPLALVVTSWWLALVAIWVLQQAHVGLSEHNELPPLMHLLRDGALAVPSAAVSVIVATLALAPSLAVEVPGARHGLSDWDRLRWVVLTALLFAVLSIPGNQLHSLLFHAEEEEIGWLADVSLDAVIALIGALIALFPIGIVVGPPMRRLHGSSTALSPRSTT
jgi:hypothetical protein